MVYKMTDGRRAVLLNGGANKPYEQAIFIVRGGGNKIGRDAVAEAEAVVNDYLRALGGADEPSGNAAPLVVKTARKRSRLDVFLSVMTLILTVSLAAMFFGANFL